MQNILRVADMLADFRTDKKGSTDKTEPIEIMISENFGLAIEQPQR